MAGSKIHPDDSDDEKAQGASRDGKSKCCHCHCYSKPETPKRESPESLNKYATKKSLTSGLLDIGLLLANFSQFKAILDNGEDSHDLFYPMLVLIGISIALQVTIGASLLILGHLNVEQKKNKHVVRLNDVTVMFASAVTILNSLIGAFGINKK